MSQPVIDPWDERYATDEYVYGTEPNDLLRQYSTTLVPGSSVICVANGEGRNGVFPAQLALHTGGPPVADLMITAADLRRELQGLDLELCHEITRHIHEGRLHHGTSAVVQCVARKPVASPPTA